MLPPHFKDLLNLSYGLGNLRNIYYPADIDILIGYLLITPMIIQSLSITSDGEEHQSSLENDNVDVISEKLI